MDNKSFILYASTERQVRMLTDEDAGKLFKAIFEYHRTGEVPELPALPAIVFAAVHDYMDDNREKYETIRAKRVQAINSRYRKEHMNTSEYKSIQKGGVSVSDTVSVSVSGSVEEEMSSTPPPTTKTPRGQFGNVMLSDQELEEWKKERPSDWEPRIQHLDDYLQDNPRKKKAAAYRDHLKKLREWARQDDNKPPAQTDTSRSFHLQEKNPGAGFSDDLDWYYDQANKEEPEGEE